MIRARLVLSSLLWLTLLQQRAWTRRFHKKRNDSVILCLQCQALHYKGVHLINRKDTHCFLLLCANHFPKHASVCMSAHTHALPHTQTHTQGPCAYLVCVNNDLGIIKSTTGISFKCLCQNDNASQYEDGISLTVLSQ